MPQVLKCNTARRTIDNNEEAKMATFIKCPHCQEEINSRATKCPFCAGGIKRGDGTGFLYNVIGTGVVAFIGGWILGENGFVDGLTWGVIGLCAGPFVWIYNAFIKPSKS